MRRISHPLAARSLASAALVAVAACSQDATAPFGADAPGTKPTPVAGERTVSVVWNDALLEAVRRTSPPPTVVARALAVMNTAMYDAWADYDAVALTTQSRSAYRRPVAERTDENKRIAMSYAAYRVAWNLIPAQGAVFDSTLRALGLTPCATCSTDLSTPEGVGVAEARAVLDFRIRDGSNQLGDRGNGPYGDYTGYIARNEPTRINDPNRWQPLAITGANGVTTIQKFATPQWGNVVPFAMTSGAQFRPDSVPNLFPSAGYEQQVREVVDYSANLTDRQKVIAEYWADGPNSELPPGHWVRFGTWVSARDGHSLDQDARMFFALANAMLDVSIAAWDCKRNFDYVRPVTAVRFLMAGKQVRAWGGPGKGTVLMDGADWKPYQPADFVTPPFPEFSSGHSAFSAAGAYVLRHFTGGDTFGASVVIPAGSSRVERGLIPAADVRLQWDTFTAAAEEAAISRLYGGIHFRQGDLQSRMLGEKVASLAWMRAQRLWTGRGE